MAQLGEMSYMQHASFLMIGIGRGLQNLSWEDLPAGGSFPVLSGGGSSLVAASSRIGRRGSDYCSRRVLAALK
jgi:hypothetical protein